MRQKNADSSISSMHRLAICYYRVVIIIVVVVNIIIVVSILSLSPLFLSLLS